jgi:hypothetical protein
MNSMSNNGIGNSTNNNISNSNRSTMNVNSANQQQRVNTNSSWNNTNSGLGTNNSNNLSSQLTLQNQNMMNLNNGNNNSNSSNNSSISEQLWGVRSSSRIGNTTMAPSSSVATTPTANTNSAVASANRNSTSFASPNISNNNNANNANSLLNQQQFFRSNSWNVNPQQVTNNNNANNSNNSNNNANNFNPLNGPINGGNFILIRGVTAQIDQSTLRALCAQHANGPLTYYRYITQMTCVIVRYNSKEESNNALSKLNGILLGNTTIFTQSLSENELKFLFTL